MDSGSAVCMYIEPCERAVCARKAVFRIANGAVYRNQRVLDMETPFAMASSMTHLFMMYFDPDLTGRVKMYSVA